MNEQTASRSFVWRKQMQRARDRLERAERERQRCFAFIPRTLDEAGMLNKLKYKSIVPEHLERRVRWLRDWLEYGQQLGERKFFTARGWLHAVGLGRRTGKSGSNS